MTDIFKSVYSDAKVSDDGIARKLSVVPMVNGHGDAGKLGIVISTSAKSSVSDSKLRAAGSMSASIVSAKKRGVGGVSSIHHYGPTRSAVNTGGVFSSMLARKGLLPLGELKEEEDEEVSESIYKLHKTELNWDRLRHGRIRTERARRYTLLFRPGDAINWENLDLKLASQETTIKIDEGYFSEGAMRTAHIMYDDSMQKQLVAKVYKPEKKHFKSDLERKELIEQDVKAQTVAKQLALAFSVQPISAASIDFIFTSYYELLDRPANHPLKYISAEPYITGDYKKYNNNNGWASEEFSDVAQAFSHFTWQETLGNLMVVDLQGVNYILTDPQIHTRNSDVDASFGLGNLGTDGMTAFFCTHTCNSICHQLKLVNFSKDKGKTTIRDEKGVLTEPSDSIISTNEMNLSCCLCGDIHMMNRMEFLDMMKKDNGKRSSYCLPCRHKIESPEQRKKCICSCSAEFDYSPYWYLMIGMEPPKSCRKCKTTAAKAVTAGRSGKR